MNALWSELSVRWPSLLTGAVVVVIINIVIIIVIIIIIIIITCILNIIIILVVLLLMIIVVFESHGSMSVVRCANKSFFRLVGVIVRLDILIFAISMIRGCPVSTYYVSHR